MDMSRVSNLYSLVDKAVSYTILITYCIALGWSNSSNPWDVIKASSCSFRATGNLNGKFRLSRQDLSIRGLPGARALTHSLRAHGINFSILLSQPWHPDSNLNDRGLLNSFLFKRWNGWSLQSRKPLRTCSPSHKAHGHAQTLTHFHIPFGHINHFHFNVL